MRTRHPEGKRRLPYRLTLLHEDPDILVVDKPAGLLSMSTDRPTDRTAYFAMMDYVRKGQAKSRNRVFIVHRLDRETSGVLLFAKSEFAKIKLQSSWDNTEKEYLAVVFGAPKEKRGTISTYLAENSAHMVYSTSDPRNGKLSHTEYTVIHEAENVSLLQINLLTGRKNQIRVHLSDIGHPIVGDTKYGNPHQSRTPLALHALSISFEHPHHHRRMTFFAPVPRHFTNLVGAAPLAHYTDLPREQ